MFILLSTFQSALRFSLEWWIPGRGRGVSRFLQVGLSSWFGSEFGISRGRAFFFGDLVFSSVRG